MWLILFSRLLFLSWFRELLWVNDHSKKAPISVYSCSAGHHELFCTLSITLTSGNCSTFAHSQPLVCPTVLTASPHWCCPQCCLWSWSWRYVHPAQSCVCLGWIPEGFFYLFLSGWVQVMTLIVWFIYVTKWQWILVEEVGTSCIVLRMGGGVLLFLHIQSRDWSPAHWQTNWIWWCADVDASKPQLVWLWFWTEST